MSRIKRNRTDVPEALKHVQGMDVKALLRRRGVYLKQRQNIELKEAAKPLATQVVKTIRGNKTIKTIVEITPPQKYMSFSDEAVATYAAKQIHSVETLEKHFDAAINKFLINTVLPKALDNVKHFVDTKSNKDVHTKDVFTDEDETVLVNQAIIELEPYLQNMSILAGQEAYKLISVDDPYIPSDPLRKLIQRNVRKFSKSMVETDQEHLTDLILAGIEQGKGAQEIATSLKSEFSDYSKMQSMRITRTEVLRSATQSTLDAFRQSGVVEGKQWVIAGAEDKCADFDGEVVTLDAGFYSDANEFQDGNPPLHPNCKCVLVPVLEGSDETKQLAIAEQQKTSMRKHIKELEAQVYKRTKAFKEIKAQRSDDLVYIKALEKYLGDDEPSK